MLFVLLYILFSLGWFLILVSGKKWHDLYRPTKLPSVSTDFLALYAALWCIFLMAILAILT